MKSWWIVNCHEHYGIKIMIIVLSTSPKLECWVLLLQAWIWFCCILFVKQSLFCLVLKLKRMGFLVNDFVGRSENPFFYEHNAKMNSNLSGEVIDVEARWDGWFDLNWGEPGFPGAVPCLVALAVPRRKFLQVEWAPDVPKPGGVCSLSEIVAKWGFKSYKLCQELCNH